MYDLGGNVPLKISVYAADGVTLTNAASVVMTVTLPDATVQTPAVTNVSTGVYTATGPSTQAGRYTVSYVTTNPTDAKTDEYDVRPGTSTALLSLADAKATLNIPAADYSTDEELRDRLDVVTATIQGLVGYVIPQTVTTTVTAGGGGFFLPGPVISLTSITPVLTNGWAYTITDLTITSGGLVTRLDGARLNGQSYTVVYQAGYPQSALPQFMEAARLLLAAYWRYQRAPGTRPAQADDDLEAQAMRILQPYRIVSVA